MLNKFKKRGGIIKIIRQGDKDNVVEIRRFECYKCGCVFECTEKEYKIRSGGKNDLVYSISCPTCNSEVTGGTIVKKPPRLKTMSKSSLGL